jgi:hypothetical protein
MTKEIEGPWRESLTLDEYIKCCKDFLLGCFDENKKLITRNNNLNIECNIRGALDVLEDMENAEWVDTSEIEEE